MSAKSTHKRVFSPKLSQKVVANTSAADAQAALINGTLAVSWINGQLYDLILLRINGEEQEPLAGDATSFNTASDLGAADVEIRGVLQQEICDNLSTSAVVSAVVVGAIRDLTCQADGLTVSLQWELGGIRRIHGTKSLAPPQATSSWSFPSVVDALVRCGELKFTTCVGAFGLSTPTRV
jgi:hypothetical protein